MKKCPLNFTLKISFPELSPFLLAYALAAIAQYNKSNIMDRIFEGSLVQQQLKLLCHQAMTGEAIVNGPNYRSSLSFPIRFLKRSMFSHNYFSLLMRGVKM